MSGPDMVEVVKPPRLSPGDVVCVTSVSSPIPSTDALDRIDKCLRDLGLEVVHGEHVLARHGYLAGDLDVRQADLGSALRNDNVRAVVFGWGGKGASHLLPALDYAAFKCAPKIVMGLSDPSAIINALHARTGVVTFHGPTGVNFADPDGLAPFTLDSLKRTLFNTAPVGDLPMFSAWQGLREGAARGRLVGGHLTTVQALLGTPYEPDWDGKIFFWEEVGRAPRDIDQILTHFRQRGVFDRIAGMVIGRPLDCDDPATDSQLSPPATINAVAAGYDFPILINVDLGHTDPKLTLPIGGMAELVVESELRLALVESCVA
jgi:muramoyltetrapeptide carboxypeptidase